MSVSAPPRVEYKTVALDRKAAEAAGTAGEFSAYCSTWDLDSTNERFARGAFAASLARRSYRPLLWDHRVGEVVGVEVSLAEDARGLLGRWRFSDTQQGRDMRQLVRSGAVRSMSVGFIPTTTRKGDGGSREIVVADLLECSLVSLPANEAAVILSSKSGGAMPSDLATLGRRLEARGIISLPARGGSLGRRVAAAPEMRALLDGRSRQASVYLADFDLKALPTGIGGTTGLYPDQTTAVPVIPSVLSYLPTIPTTDGFISVPIASTPTGAAAVGAATATAGATGTKPEVVVGYASTPVPMATIAGHITATRTALEDGDELARLVDADLRQAVLDALEAEVLAGSGTPPSMTGIANTAGVGSVAATTGQDVAALVQAIGQVVTSSRRMPTLIAISATSWAALIGNAAAQSFAAMLSSAGIVLVPTAALPGGTALVGVAATAALYTQVGLAVTSGFTDNQFVRNVVTIRGEVRAVVALSKPAAWSKVTNLAVTP